MCSCHGVFKVSKGNKSLYKKWQSMCLSMPVIGQWPMIQFFSIILPAVYALQWIWNKTIKILYTIHLATSVDSHILNKQQWDCSIGSHICQCYNTTSINLDTWCALGQEQFIYFADFLFPSCYFQFTFAPSVQRIWFPFWFFSWKF